MNHYINMQIFNIYYCHNVTYITIMTTETGFVKNAKGAMESNTHHVRHHKKT